MHNDQELEIFYNQNKQTKVEIISKKNNQRILKLAKQILLIKLQKVLQRKNKIRNLISENSTKQRNISLCIYLKNYFLQKYKNIVIANKNLEVKMLQRFEELAFRNIAEQEDSDKIAAYVWNLQELFYKRECILQKESAFYEKRIICRYLSTLLSQENYSLVGYPDLVNKYKDQQALISIYLQIIGNFIKNFLNKQREIILNQYLQHIFFMNRNLEDLMLNKQ
ncbi:unnamed protein product [Paramecium sonneborni]|uniref:Uncharacterized protein n=1 Tax=Paramecium sonneborni TaxID=65129 RepID=A0A8S1QIY0_9CILI|nr:unnamed protein product [Paramecium sonneborni]